MGWMVMNEIFLFVLYKKGLGKVVVKIFFLVRNILVGVV